MTSAHGDDFPVPADLEGFWVWEKGHFPRPMTPLSQDLIATPAIQGFTNAQDELASPIWMGLTFINYYPYINLAPFDPGSETMEQRAARYEGLLANIVTNIGELWEGDWLPSILPGLDKAKNFDYAAMSDAQLLDTLNEMAEDQLHRWTVHGRINYSVVAASQFADFYKQEFQTEEATEPYVALQGFPTRSVDAGRGLWRLSRVIKESPALTETFEEASTAELVSRLQQSSEGQAFLGQLTTYLDEFGWRSDSLFELSEPTWRELPTIPLNILQGYVRLDESQNPDRLLAEATARREEMLAAARSKLAGDPEKLARFNKLYNSARHNLPITENHNYYIDQMGGAVLRLPAMEIGRRLVQRNAIDRPEDVFLIHVAELPVALAGTDQRPVVGRRKQEMERWSRVLPPPFLGQPPPPSGDPWEDAIIGRMLGFAPLEPSADPAVINGHPASPGTVQGRAKVVRDLTEASKVEPGDILVCEMTMPSWTPLFSIVSAVVSDTGGILSHCAVVSREYHIPCVVGTMVATHVIKDGMLLTVDGKKGIVRIDSTG